jgi:hypothetical protein
MKAPVLAIEATRYLEAIDLFRSLESNVTWRTEADEVGAFGAARATQLKSACDRCAHPHIRINGRHVCFGD